MLWHEASVRSLQTVQSASIGCKHSHASIGFDHVLTLCLPYRGPNVSHSCVCAGDPCSGLKSLVSLKVLTLDVALPSALTDFRDEDPAQLSTHMVKETFEVGVCLCLCCCCFLLYQPAAAVSLYTRRCCLYSVPVRQDGAGSRRPGEPVPHLSACKQPCRQPPDGMPMTLLPACMHCLPACVAAT